MIRASSEMALFWSGVGGGGATKAAYLALISFLNFRAGTTLR